MSGLVPTLTVLATFFLPNPAQAAWFLLGRSHITAVCLRVQTLTVLEIDLRLRRCGPLAHRAPSQVELHRCHAAVA